MLRYLQLCILALLLFSGSLPALAQKAVRISGTIVESDKTTPIPGAGITRVGTTMGVISDADGKFMIDIQTTDTLLIRAIGFKSMLYMPQRLPVSEIRVNIVLQEDSVMLGEVEITNRPSEEMIQRMLRNMKHKEPHHAKNPGYVAGSEPPPPPPAAPASIASPISLLYEQFSKEGKQNRKLQELLLLKQLELQREEYENYNRFFKDNRGYEN